MLELESSILAGPFSVRLRVSPSIQQVSAFSGAPSGMTGRFLRGRAVVDHPEFMETGNAHDDLIEFRVIVNGVHMQPVGISGRCIIDIYQFRMIFDDAEVVLGRIEILDEMIPDAPRPHDLAAFGRRGPNFDNLLRPECTGG